MDRPVVYRDGNRTTTYYPHTDGITLIQYSDKTWGVKFQNNWLPGKYADRDAALYAIECPLRYLTEITHHSIRGTGVNYRPLTLDELKEVR